MATKKLGLVSVVVTCYNRKNYIEACLTSLFLSKVTIFPEYMSRILVWNRGFSILKKSRVPL